MTDVATERELTEARIYWDSQDRNNEGWAYRLNYSDGHRESGAVENLPDHADHEQIAWAMDYLTDGLARADEILHEDVDGGVHIWSSPE